MAFLFDFSTCKNNLLKVVEVVAEAVVVEVDLEVEEEEEEDVDFVVKSS